MANAILTGAQMYMDKVIKYPYIKSKFAVLADKSKFQYSKFGEKTLVREVTPGTSSDYDEATGFAVGGTGGSVTWEDFTAEYDRQYTAPVGALQEMNSILEGMELGGTALVEAWYNQEGAEIDALACAKIYSKTPVSNRLTINAHPIDKTHIIDTLLYIDGQIRNNGEEDAVAVFIRNSVYSDLQSAIVDNYGLASDAVLTYTTSANNEEGKIDVELRVKKLNDRMYLIPVPDNRMISNVTLLDGFSDGQTAGGFVPDTSAEGYCNIYILAVPFNAAAESFRHIVANMTVPAMYQAEANNVDISALQDYYDGSMTILNIGVDQNGDQWKYMNRIVFGTAVFSNRTMTIFSVSDLGSSESANITADVDITSTAKAEVLSTFGIDVDNNQNLTVSGNTISGELEYVETATTFDMSKGHHFAVLHFASDNADTIRVKLNPTQGSGWVTLDSDGVFVGQVTENTVSILVEASGDNVTTTTTVYALNLTLKAE